MGKLPGTEWQSVKIYTRSSEFVGDDVDRFSQLADLGGDTNAVGVFIPRIETAAVYVYVQNDSGIDTVPVKVYYHRETDGKEVDWCVKSGTGNYYKVCKELGGIRYLRLYASANQTATRTFKVAGMEG